MRIDIRRISNHSAIIEIPNEFERLSGYLLIFGLAGGQILNILLYYLGIHKYSNLRSLLFIIFTVVVFCMATLRFLQLITKISDRRRILISLIYPICGIMIFCGAFIVFGKSAYKSINLLLQFGCFCIPAFIFGLDCALNHRERNLFMTLDAVSIFYVPFAVCGIYTVFSSNNIFGKIENIGELNYMSIAYSLLLPTVYLVTRVLLFPDSRFLNYEVEDNPKSHRVSTVIHTGLALLFWYVILSTGTRGAIMCVFALFLLHIIGSAYIRSNKVFLLTLKIFLIFAIIFSLFIFIPNNSHSANHTTKFFINGLLHGKFQTSNTKAVSKMDLEKITSMPITTTSNTFQKNQELLDPSEIVMNREQLYTAATKEFIKSPLFGMGPMGFYTKYDRYVHNFILEVLCDYGMVGIVLIFGVIIILLIRFIRSARTDFIYIMMLALLLSMNLPLLVSGSFISWAPFWFFMGYAGLNFYDNKGL